MTTGTTQTPLTELVPDLQEPGVRSVFKAKNAIMNTFSPQPGASNGTVKWILGDIGTDNAETTSEGATLPDPNVSETMELSIATQTYDVVAKVTQEAIDRATDQGINAWTYALNEAAIRLGNKANVTMMTEFESAVDSTGAYGGLTRTSYPEALVSYKESTTDSLSDAYLEAMMLALMDGDRQVDWSDLRLYMSPTMLFKYGNLANQSTTFARSTNRQVGGKSDAGLVFSTTGDIPSYNGVPIVVMNGMTATTIIMGPGGMAGEGKTVEEYGPRIKPLGKVDRTERAVIDCSYKFRIKQPALWGKLTNKS